MKNIYEIFLHSVDAKVSATGASWKSKLASQQVFRGDAFQLDKQLKEEAGIRQMLCFLHYSLFFILYYLLFNKHIYAFPTLLL